MSSTGLLGTDTARFGNVIIHLRNPSPFFVIDKKFKSDTWASYLAQAVSIASGFVFMALVTRYAGIAVFGALAVLTALSNMLANLLTFRTNEAVIAFYKQGEATGDLARSKFALVAGMALDLLLGGGLFLLVYSQADTIANLLIKDAGAAPEVRLYAGFLFIFFIRGSAVGYLQACERFKLVSYLSMSEHFAKALAAGGIVMLYGKLNLYHAVLALLIPACVFSLVYLIAIGVGLARRLGTVPLSLDKGKVGEFARFSSSTFLSSTLKAGNQNIDTVMVGYLTDTHTVGLYGLFRQFLSPLAFLSTPFSSLTYPKFVQAVVEHRHSDIRRAIASINRKLRMLFLATLAVMIPAFLFYALWIDLPIQWDKWLVIIMMTLTTVIIQQMWWARPFSNAVNPNISLRANLYALVFVVVTIYPATLWLGLAGAAGVMLTNALLQRWYWTFTLNSVIGKHVHGWKERNVDI